MKIIWRDRLQRETESERMFILNVPEREGLIMTDALNAHAKGNDHYECVVDSYILYRFRVSTKGYFVALSEIWREWFRCRKEMSGMTILQRDKMIAELQAKWRPDQPAPKISGMNGATGAHQTKPKVTVSLEGLL